LGEKNLASSELEGRERHVVTTFIIKCEGGGSRSGACQWWASVSAALNFGSITREWGNWTESIEFTRPHQSIQPSINQVVNPAN